MSKWCTAYIIVQDAISSPWQEVTHVFTTREKAKSMADKLTKEHKKMVWWPEHEYVVKKVGVKGATAALQAGMEVLVTRDPPRVALEEALDEEDENERWHVLEVDAE